MTDSSSGTGVQQQPQATTSEGNNVDLSNDMSFLYDLTSAPCFRQSMMFGIGGGGAIGALSLMRNRNFMQSAGTMVKTGCGIAIVAWIACRRQYYVEREMTYGSLERYRRQMAQRAAVRAEQMRREQTSSTSSASNSNIE